MGELVVNGTLSAQIAGVYPLARIREAMIHALKHGEERTGKVILVP
jgi:NADPH:quinone reductase-like Zn-dependent oxidoreductase